MKSLPEIRKKVSIILFVFAIPAMYYIFYHQTRENNEAMLPIIERIVEYETADPSYPVRMLREKPKRLFFHDEAIHAVKSDDAQKYWLVTTAIFPLFNINYWVYPNEVYMSAETQTKMYTMALWRQMGWDNPIPPRQYDKVLMVDQFGARIADEWDGFVEFGVGSRKEDKWDGSR